MPKFEVELKKVVDDSYEIEIGHGLLDLVVADLANGLVGKLHKFAIITDSNVEPLYARPLEQKLLDAGYQTDVFVFPAGEKSKTRQTKAMIEDAMLEKGYRRDCCILAVGGGVVTDLAGFIASYFAEHDYKKALKYGAATGSATAFSEGLATKDQVEKLLGQF